MGEVEGTEETKGTRFSKTTQLSRAHMNSQRSSNHRATQVSAHVLQPPVEHFPGTAEYANERLSAS